MQLVNLADASKHLPELIEAADISKKCQYLCATAFQQAVTRLQTQLLSTQN